MRGSERIALLGRVVDAIAPLRDRYVDDFDQLGFDLSVEACVAPRLTGRTYVGVLVEVENRRPNTGPHGHAFVAIWRRNWMSTKWKPVKPMDEALEETEKLIQNWRQNLAESLGGGS